MRYKNNISPQVRRRRYALGWSQSVLATKLRRRDSDMHVSITAYATARKRCSILHRHLPKMLQRKCCSALGRSSVNRHKSLVYR